MDNSKFVLLNAWRLLCCLLLLAAIITETKRYIKNEGKVSSVAHRIFHEAEEDRYPAFSICLEMLDTYSFNLKYRSVDSNLDKIKDEMPISDDSFLISTTSILENGQVQYDWMRSGNQWNQSERGSEAKEPKVLSKNLQFYENPNLPRRYCLTRNNSREENEKSIKNYDIIRINKSLLTPHRVSLLMYVHHPGQLMRSYHKHDYLVVLSPTSTVPSFVSFQLVFVSVSRLRENAKIRCIDDNGREDFIRRKYITGTFIIVNNCTCISIIEQFKK